MKVLPAYASRLPPICQPSPFKRAIHIKPVKRGGGSTVAVVASQGTDRVKTITFSVESWPILALGPALALWGEPT